MNQILQVKENNKNSKHTNTKDIVLLFVIFIIIFAIAGGVYLIYKNIDWDKFINPDSGNTIKVPENVPIITLTKNEENKLIINVESQLEIYRITYNWNNEIPQVIGESGKNNIEKIIDIPLGENTIYVSAIDTSGVESKKEETFIIEAPRPEIELAVVGNYIKIEITSEVELAKVTYKWNSEEEKIDNMLTYSDKTKFEKKIEIPIGKNTLYIVAIDKNGGKTEKSQEIKGVTKATTTTQVIGEYLHFTVTGKEEIKKVEFEFNGKKYLMNTDTFGQTKTVHYKVKLVEGTNYLQIKSTTQSGGEDITTWNQEYTR